MTHRVETLFICDNIDTNYTSIIMYNKTMKIGLLEDDRTLSYGIKRFLIQEGYEVSLFSTVHEAKKSEKNCDLYLVDIALPDGEGYEFVENLRKTSNVPVIYVTAKDDEESLLKGFDFGGDDYITKPFSLNELKRRINAIKRRIQPSIISIGDLFVNVENAVVTHKETEINLSVQEYRILIALIRNKETYVSREELYDLLGIPEELINENTLNVAIKRLRSKLKVMVNIETIHGKGYKIHA